MRVAFMYGPSSFKIVKTTQFHLLNIWAQVAQMYFEKRGKYLDIILLIKWLTKFKQNRKRLWVTEKFKKSRQKTEKLFFFLNVFGNITFESRHKFIKAY